MAHGQKTKIFISYKTGTTDGLTGTANHIRQLLKAEKYDVWMDSQELVGSQKWNEEIYEAIPKSDIVLLLLAKKTATSEWVQREITVARVTRVTVIPVVIRQDFDADMPAHKILDEKFDLPRTQYQMFVNGDEAEFEKLKIAIEQIKHETRRKQEEWITDLQENPDDHVPTVPYTPPTKSVSRYTIPNAPQYITLHLAGGDMTEMRNIDVLVNTENSYMQMARIFESSSLSSKLRWHGSRKRRNGHVREDILQQELYEQITLTAEEYTLPINLGAVVSTHAGHKSSKLVKENQIRYIFHVATVEVKPDINQDVVPATNQDIHRGVVSALKEVLFTDERKGVISPEGTVRCNEEQDCVDTYEPIRSIMFPIFTSGRGGRKDVREIAQVMLNAMTQFVVKHKDNPALHLMDIYLCAYTNHDLDAVREAADMLLTAGDVN